MDTFAQSEEMTLEFCKNQNVFIHVFQGMMRLFAPLL
jgi:cardiolipin synthase